MEGNTNQDDIADLSTKDRATKERTETAAVVEDNLVSVDEDFITDQEIGDSITQLWYVY